jgi:hypothetical protein
MREIPAFSRFSLNGTHQGLARSMEGFLALYTRITKEDIRRNRDNVGERLGFLGRVIHGTNARAWLKEMRQRLGEKMDFASAVAG